MKHPIPDDTLDDRLALVGTAGAGKTYNAGGAVERVLQRHGRVVIPDPLGVWWGLRLLADGKTPSPFSVVIFGGPHGDLPISEHAGALIGETVAGMAESAIIDLSQLGTKAAERRFMLAFLTAFYKHATNEPVHVVFDEADMWAPQRLMDRDGDAARLLGMMETVVRRGRVRGFIPWLITQRPAVLSKDVLSQVDGLVSFKLTSSQDRDAIGAWVEGSADKQQWRDIWASLPTMQRGGGVVWVPARGILATAAFPPKTTYDSSRTPKRGEMVRSATLKPINLEKLEAKLATVKAEKAANDPAELRKQIADLKAQLARATTVRPPVAELVEAEKIGFEKGKQAMAAEAKRIGQQTIVSALADLRKMVVPLLEALDAGIKTAAISFPDVSKDIQFKSGLPSVVNSTVDTPIGAPNGRLQAVRKPLPVPAGGNGTVGGSEQRIINAIRWWNVFGIAAPSHAQVGFIAGFSHKSGTWTTYLSRLRSRGLIEGRGDLVLTEIGLAAAAGPATAPTVGALHAAVLDKIDAPLRKILQPLLEVYPDGLSHEEAGRRAGYSSSSGTWATYLSRLRSLDLISGRSELKAEAWLFAR